MVPEMIDITEHLGLVNRVVWQMNTLPMDKEEAFQEGCVALLEVSRRYDGRGNFSTYAYPRIKGAIKDAQRKMLGRYHLKPHNGALSIEFNEVDVWEYDKDLESVERSDFIKYSKEILKKALPLLPERAAYVVWQRSMGRKFREIGDACGVGESRVHQIYYEGLQKLREIIGEENDC